MWNRLSQNLRVLYVGWETAEVSNHSLQDLSKQRESSKKEKEAPESVAALFWFCRTFLSVLQREAGRVFDFRSYQWWRESTQKNSTQERYSSVFNKERLSYWLQSFVSELQQFFGFSWVLSSQINGIISFHTSIVNEGGSLWNSRAIGATQQQQKKILESSSQLEQSAAKTADCGILPVVPSSETTSTTEPVLYHYVLVRKDLPFGTALAQTVHAAGESAQNTVVPPNTHAVVLAVPDEKALLDVEAKLLQHGIEIKSIREPDMPWCGQLMTIGIKPQPREKIRKLLSNLPLYK